MTNFVTILTLFHPTELYVAKSKLESFGIECLIVDELTTQINPVYSDAIGGVKLQVKENNVEEAIKLLKEGGYIKNDSLKVPGFFVKADTLISKIPLLNLLPFVFWLIILIAIVIVTLVSIFYFATLPSTYENLTKHTWCVDRITYNDNDCPVNTISILQITGSGFCEENIGLRTNGMLTLPGLNSRMVLGNWKLKNDSLYIMQTDTFDFVYNGTYTIDFSDNKLILKSKQTIIYGHPQTFY